MSRVSWRTSDRRMESRWRQRGKCCETWSEAARKRCRRSSPSLCCSCSRECSRRRWGMGEVTIKYNEVVSRFLMICPTHVMLRQHLASSAILCQSLTAAEGGEEACYREGTSTAQSLDSHALGETIMRTRRRTASPSPSPTDCVTLTSRRHINPQPRFTSTAAAADYH